MIISDICYSKHLRLDWNYSLYLPDSWHNGIDYPVLYLLHGAGGFHKDFWIKYHLETIIKQVKKELEWQDFIIAMPDGFNSYYFNGPTLAMEDAIMRDFIRYIEERYTSGHRAKSQRMIAGFSMGGYGALRYAIHYPYQFSQSYLVAPAIWVDEPHPQSLLRSTMHLFNDKENRFSVDIWQNQHPFTLLDQYEMAQSPVHFTVLGASSDATMPQDDLEHAIEILAEFAEVSWEILPTHNDNHSEFYGYALKRILTQIAQYLTQLAKG